VSSPTRTYLYALLRAKDDAQLAIDDAGIDDAPVRVVAADDLAAVVSTVAAESFDPASIEAHMADLTWLESVARAHDRVVSAAARAATVIPLRLGTTCADDASARELLTDLSPAALRTFDRLDGRWEFGVQLLATTRSRPPNAGPSESGVAFLRRRQAELQQDDAVRAAETQLAQAAFEGLAALAVDSRRNPPRETTPTGAAMLLNGVFLVDSDVVARFRAAVDDLAASLGQERVVLTGPWAPYSFAELAP
jgi:hypothetical protein